MNLNNCIYSGRKRFNTTLKLLDMNIISIVMNMEIYT